jgi:hypothetical protein
MLTMKPSSALCQMAKRASQFAIAHRTGWASSLFHKDCFKMTYTQNTRHFSKDTGCTPLVVRNYNTG